MKKKRFFKSRTSNKCHGCAYYNVYGDYCTQKGLVCRFKSLEDIYRKKNTALNR